MEIADLIVKLRADSSQLTAGISKAEHSVTSFGMNLSKAGLAMTAGITVPAIAAVKEILQIGLAYESSLNVLKAVTSATGEQMARASALAKQLGADITLPATSAADAAKAMTELAKGGFSVEQAMAAAKGTLQLAAAATIDEARAAEIAANAINAFKLNASDASRVADILANAANASSAEINDIALSLQQASSVFSQAHVPIETVVAAIGEMANAGIKGSDAGTSLKTMMLALEAPTSKAAKVMKDMGISVFDAQGQFMPFRDIVSQFSTALAGMTDQQQAFALKTIFGTDAIRAANVVMKGGVEALDAMQEAVTKQGGAADLANAKMQGLTGAFQSLKSQVETVAIDAFEALKVQLEPVVRFISDLIPKVQDTVKAFAEANPEVVHAAETFGLILAVAGPVALAIGGIVAAIGTIGIPLLAAITAVEAFALAYTENWGGLKDSVDGFVKDITGFYKDHKIEIDLLATVVKDSLGIMVKTWAESAALIIDSMKLVTVSMRLAAGDWGAAWEMMTDAAKKQQEKSKKDAEGWMGGLFKAIVGQVTGIPAIVTTARLAWEQMRTVTLAVWESIKAQAVNAWNAIGDAITAPIQRSLDWLKSKVAEFRGAFAGITEAAKIGLQVHSPPIAAIWIDMIGDSAGKAAEATRGAVPKFGDAFSAISAFAHQHLPKIASIFVDLAGTVVKVLGELGVQLPKILGSIFGQVSHAGQAGANAGTGLGKAVTSGFSDAISGAGGILDAFEKGLSTMISTFQDPSKVKRFLGGFAAFGVVGGLFSLIFGGPSELQKAQMAAQLQQAKDAIKLSQESVAQAFEATKQSIIETMSRGRDLLESIVFYTSVPKTAFNAFFRDLDKLMKYFADRAKEWAMSASPNIKAFAEDMKAIMEGIAQAPTALINIGKYLGIPEASIARFFADLGKVLETFGTLGEDFTRKFLRHARQFAERIGDAVGLIPDITAGITGLVDIKPIPIGNLDIWEAALKEVTNRIGIIAENFDKNTAKVIGFFAEKVGPAIDLWKNSIDALKSMVDLPTPSGQDFDNLFESIRIALEGMSDLASTLSTEALVKAQAVAETSLAIFAAIKAAVESFKALGDYKTVAQEAIDAIVQDFKRGIVLLNLLILDATDFADKAKKFDEIVTAGAASLAHGMSTYVGAFKDMAASLLQLPQGGLSLAPAAGGFSTTSIHVTVQGSLIQQNELDDAIVQSLSRAERQRGKF